MTITPTLIAAVLQLLFAATWFIIPIVALMYGARAQEAATKAVSNQGFDKDLLLKNGIKFFESRIESIFSKYRIVKNVAHLLTQRSFEISSMPLNNMTR